MAHTIIHPHTMMIHSQYTSITYTTMMGTWRLIKGTLLAVSHIPTLSLDLLNRILRVFDIGYEWARNTTRISVYCKWVTQNAEESNDGKQDGVKYTGRRPKSQPLINEYKYSGEVNVSNCRRDEGDVEGESAATCCFHLRFSLAGVVAGRRGYRRRRRRGWRGKWKMNLQVGSNAKLERCLVL